jgi:hypothetical protein
MGHASGSVTGIHSKLYRLFDYAKIIIDGKPMRGVRIRCADCGKTDVIHMNTMRWSSSNEDKECRQVTRRFETGGWRVGEARAKHLCPACIEKSNNPQELSEEQAEKFLSLCREIPTVRDLAHAWGWSKSRVDRLLQKRKASQKGEEPVTSATVTAIPRKMTRDERRIIYAKIEEVWGSEDSGYKPPWTDKKVAEDLGVPQAWVATLRDENFGSKSSNPAIEEQGRAAMEFVAEMRSKAQEITAMAKALLDKAEVIERRLIDIQKAVRP